MYPMYFPPTPLPTPDVLAHEGAILDVPPWVPSHTTARPGLPKNGYPDRPGAGVNVLIRWLTDTRCNARCGAPAGRTCVDGSRDSNGAIGVVRIAPARSGSTEDTARPPWPFVAAARHAAGGAGRAS